MWQIDFSFGFHRGRVWLPLPSFQTPLTLTATDWKRNEICRTERTPLWLARCRSGVSIVLMLLFPRAFSCLRHSAIATLGVPLSAQQPSMHPMAFSRRAAIAGFWPTCQSWHETEQYSDACMAHRTSVCRSDAIPLTADTGNNSAFTFRSLPASSGSLLGSENGVRDDVDTVITRSVAFMPLSSLMHGCMN